MRRLLLSLFTAGFFLGMLTGCQNFFCHTAGICDCDLYDDPCLHRAPWVRGPVAPIPGDGVGVGGCGPGGCGNAAATPAVVKNGASAPGAVIAQPASRIVR